MTTWILPLTATSCTLETIGGKGASLARMAAAGLPVPTGFHLTTAAYCCFVAENKLQSKIMEAVAATILDQPAIFEKRQRK
jgi:pyruvate,water dikinase